MLQQDPSTYTSHLSGLWHKKIRIGKRVKIGGGTVSAFVFAALSLFASFVVNVVSQYFRVSGLAVLAFIIIIFIVICGLIDYFVWKFKKIATDQQGIRERLNILTLHTLRVAGTTCTVAINGVEYSFVFCPKGSFQRPNQPNKTIINEDFLILDVPVTQQMWKSVMGDNPSRFDSEKATFRQGFPDVRDTANFPVECVNRDRCEAFIKELNLRMTQESVFMNAYAARLPTRDEWEYACRAGTSTNCYWGNNPDPAKGNFGNTRTSEVRSYKANPWNIYDMLGNVDEWTSFTLANGDGILCGGSWDDNPQKVNSSSIEALTPNTSQNLGYMGFRFVLSLVPMSLSMSR